MTKNYNPKEIIEREIDFIYDIGWDKKLSESAYVDGMSRGLRILKFLGKSREKSLAMSQRYSEEVEGIRQAILSWDTLDYGLEAKLHYKRSEVSKTQSLIECIDRDIFEAKQAMNALYEKAKEDFEHSPFQFEY